MVSKMAGAHKGRRNITHIYGRVEDEETFRGAIRLSQQALPQKSFAAGLVISIFAKSQARSMILPLICSTWKNRTLMVQVPAVFFLNGPGANLYGLDRSGTYGSESFATIRQRCEVHAASLGLALNFRQSNHEGILVDWIQEARGTAQGIIINAAGLTYTSVAILDALLAFEGPVIEAHMSNIWKREPFRHRSFVSKAATGVIAGLGVLGYELALTAVASLIAKKEAA
jgi:3-dehydroquinate dehydratase-2